jgi:ankyrin repeat protein
MDRGREKLFFDGVKLGQRKTEIIKESRERLKKYFDEEERYAIAEFYVTSKKMWYASEASKVQKTIDGLPKGPFDFGAKQAEDIEKSNGSPPDWVEKDQSYQDWISGTSLHHRWLWCLGNVGVGKTTLVSYLAGRLNAHTELSRGVIEKEHLVNDNLDDRDSRQPLQQSAVALFYGDYENKGEQRPDYVFQCLIRQLLQQLLKSNIDRALEYCDQIEKLGDSTSLSHSISWTDVLNGLASEFRRTYVIVDALDKEETDYEALIARLDQLRSPSLKLLVTSRDEQSMRDDAAFWNAMPMTILADDVLVESYVHKRLERIREHDETAEIIGTSALPSVLAAVAQYKRVAELIVSTAGGNFYYAEVQINSLLGERTTDDVHQKLGILVGSLTEMIRLDIKRVAEQRDKYKCEIGQKAIMFAAFAGRAPSVEETRHAVVLLVHPTTRENPREYSLKAESMTMEFLIECSCRLLRVDDRTNLVHVDKAIKNYCHGSNDFRDAHYDIAEVCLVYLDRMSFSLRCSSEEKHSARKREHMFYDYAARFWGFHVGRAGEKLFIGPTSPVSLLTLLSRKLFLNAVASALHEDLQGLRMWNWIGHDTWKACKDVKKAVLQPMHLLTYFDLPRIADWWLRQNPHDAEGRSATGTTPLYLACTLGHVRIVECLLFDYDADPALKGSRPSGYNLAAAVSAQSTEIVERLLYVNPAKLLEQSNRRGRRPLSEAVKRGDLDIIRMIIDAFSSAPNGTDLLISEDDEGYTALHEAAAASNPSVEVMKMLVNAPGGREFLQKKTIEWEDTALHIAARGRKHEAVKALLELGADPAMRQIQGRTPLMLAVERPFIDNGELIKTLWASTADHDIQDDGGNTLWHIAAIYGRPNNLTLLIELSPKSMFNVTNKDSQTPIRVAVTMRNNAWRRCIEVLLKTRPNHNHLTMDDANAILYTLIRDHHETSLRALELLLHHPGGKVSLLYQIVHHGSLEAVKMAWSVLGSAYDSASFLEDRYPEDGSTPLILAARISDADKALFLVGAGADVHAKDTSGKTALDYAVEHGLVDLVAKLRDAGAEESVGRVGGT